MYKSFRVKNFRCFKDLQINDLGRVNLIAGKNNTGKTALMEAMYIHTGNRDVNTLLRSSQSQSFLMYRASSHYSPEYDNQSRSIVNWDSVFYNFETHAEIVLSAEICTREVTLFDDQFESSVTLSTKSIDSYDLDDILAQLNIEEFDSFTQIDILAISSDYNRQSAYLAILDGRLVRSRRKTKPLLESDFLLSRQVLNEELISRQITSMQQQNSMPTVLAAMKAIEPRLKRIELWFDGRRPLVKCDIGLRQLLSLGELGEGITRISNLILAMSEVPGGVVFIDEIENGIHHSVQCEVWKAIGRLARDLDIQVFATTHSLEMIRAAYEAFTEDDKLDEFRYHRLDRDDEGHIEAVTYNEPALDAIASFDFDFEVRG